MDRSFKKIKYNPTVPTRDEKFSISKAFSESLLNRIIIAKIIV